VARFNISALDHVAIGVADVGRSCEFYARVLGFERLIPEWDVPVVMGVGDFGLAIFDRALHPSATPDDADPPSVRIMHIAFRVDREGLDAARRELESEGEEFGLRFWDHGISHSIYFRDPDGHLIELTTYEV
jgi:catechol 2,3-dioxygenase-like lactoylglutathione lyase family enzyme